MLRVEGSREERDTLESIAREVRAAYESDSSGHDLAHAWRVCNLGLDIATEEGADREVVGAAALVHDLHRIRGGEFTHPKETLDRVDAILDAAGFPAGKTDEVRHCVAVHEYYGFDYGPESDRPETIEAEVLRDADNLDAIGAIGIARAFAFAGANDRPLWVPEEGKGTFEHFEAKLLRLRDDLHTETAREMAEERHAFTREFVERFEAEWHGRR